MRAGTGTSAPKQSEQFSDPATWLGFIAWSVMLWIVIGYTLIGSNHHNVTAIYRAASEAIVRGGVLYPNDGINGFMGFLYFPGFAVMYLPFDRMGARIGDAVWKVAGCALVTYAAWSQCQDVTHGLRIRVLSLALGISIPLLAGSVLNGQAGIHMAAACWLMILSAFRRQTATLILWTGIAVLAKPLAIVAVLLIAGLRPRTIPALACGIALALALPFVATDGQYVLALYSACWQMLSTMTVSSRFPAADFTAVFLNSGWPLGLADIVIIRCVAAVAIWMVALWFDAHLSRNAAALAAMVLAATYMCLFNPRAEGLTYAILALPCAVVIALHLCEGQERPLWTTAATILVLLGCNGIFGAIFNMTRLWFKPIVTMLLLTLIGIAVAKTWIGSPRTFQLLDGQK
jgi:hypothetical protein